MRYQRSRRRTGRNGKEVGEAIFLLSESSAAVKAAETRCVLMHAGGRLTRAARSPKGSIVRARRRTREKERLESRPSNFSFHGAHRWRRRRPYYRPGRYSIASRRRGSIYNSDSSPTYLAYVILRLCAPPRHCYDIVASDAEILVDPLGLGPACIP